MTTTPFTSLLAAQEQNAVLEINAMGQPCPMPLLMLKRGMKSHPEALCFLLKASDANSQTDVTRYCQIHELHCDCAEMSAQEFHYFIRKPNI